MFDFTYEINKKNIKNSDISKIVDIIKEYGICVIPYYTPIINLKKDVLKSFEERGNTYEFGEYLRMGKEYKNYNNLNDYFNDPNFKKITSMYLKEHSYDFNANVFSTKDYKTDKGLARNGYLHFDRSHMFKFFVYLSDVDENSGPLSVVPKSHLIGKKLRESFQEKANNYEEIKNRIKLDFPELYKQNEIIPILGKMGSLIIFDTDIFHKGGETNGKERLIIRGHTKIK